MFFPPGAPRGAQYRLEDPAERSQMLAERFDAELVTYADDFVVLCKHGADEVHEIIRRWMVQIGLALNEEKTSVKQVWNEAFDFLGYRFGVMHSARNGRPYLGATPSKKAISRLRMGVCGHLHRGNQAPWPEVARALNRTVRGWANYFGYGTLSKVRQSLDWYIHERVQAFLRRRHKLSTRGTDRFGTDEVFGKLGVFSLSKLPAAHAFPRNLSESRMTEIVTSGSMSGSRRRSDGEV